MEIEVPTQKFITSLTRKDIPTLCVLLNVFTEKPHRSTRPHGCRVVGFERMDHIIEMCDSLFRCKCYFRVISVEVLCNGTSRFKIRTSLETYRECFDLPQFFGCNGTNQTTVETTR